MRLREPSTAERQGESPGSGGYIKSPFNYIGGKYKLLPQILPHFPDDIGIFADLFSGGANVAVNVAADQLICSDINSKIIEIFQTFQKKSIVEIIQKIDDRIEEYSLSETNEAGFLKFRERYNEKQDPIDLYTLSCYSFNYQLRFNSRHEYNNPFGRHRSRFSKNMRSNLIRFVNKIKEENIAFTACGFEKFQLSALGPKDLIYCDPPYLITTGSYNDGNRGFKNWEEGEERRLYEFLDMANDKKIRFALSNVINHKGKTNHILLDWSGKYKIIDLSFQYANSSHNTKRGKSREVLIVNY